MDRSDVEGIAEHEDVEGGGVLRAEYGVESAVEVRVDDVAAKEVDGEGADHDGMGVGALTDAGKDRLALPGGVKRGGVNWGYAGPIVFMHLLVGLAFVPGFFSWTGVVVMVVALHFFGGFGIALGYHRLLSHRSLKVPKWLERCFVLTAICHLQDSPGKWVATHRMHHNHSDDREDPHSPLVNFVWSHMGWLMMKNPGMRSIAVYQKYAKDILSDPFYMKLEKLPWLPTAIYGVHVVVWFLLSLGIGWLIYGMGSEAMWFAGGMVVWGVIVRTVVGWHVVWSVNSLTHMFGYRNYETGENSKNNWLVALVTVGEGWHNNHHYDPPAATVQRRWWEIDVTYYVIKLLEKVGLAWDVVEVKEKRRAGRGSSNAD